MEQNGNDGLDWVLVAILTATGLALRLAYLVQVPPFLDEYSSILTGMSILRTGGVPLLPSGVLYPSGSLFSYLEAATLGLFGFSDTAARLPSLLVSVATLPVLYVVARQMLNRRVALLSVAFLAVMPEAVVWGGRARMYALLQLLVLLAVFFFYRSALDAGAKEDGRPSPSWPWVVCFLAAIFAQDEAILLLPILWLAALIVRGPRWFLQPAVLFGQLFLPLAGIGIRYWLNEIRVPGEVLVGVHATFFRFPPAVAHGLEGIAPFFLAPWIWPISLLFCLGLGFLVYDLVLRYRTGTARHLSHPVFQALRLGAPLFLTYVVLTTTFAIVWVVSEPWQDDRYLFMILPLFLMVASWELDRLVGPLAQRWPVLRTRGATIALVALVTVVFLPAGLSALDRYEPDYSAAYRWVATQLTSDDLVTTMRPAPAAVYLGRCDFMVAEDKHREFIMRLNGEWVDRWAGAKVIESPEAFRDQVLSSGRQVWFVIDENRFESAAYSPEFVALILDQMDLVWHEGGVLVFLAEGYRPPPDMAVERSLSANFADQLLLTGYALSTDHPRPGDEVILHLYWRAIRPERNYTVFVHIVGADGQGLTQVDGQPFLGLYSMATHWPRDRDVLDARRLTIPPDTSPGRYRLDVGLYDADDVDAGPLPVLDAAGNPVRYSVILDYLHVNTESPPEPTQAVPEGNLGGLVRLMGYDPPLPVEVMAGTALPLTLTWESLGEMEVDYSVFIHLVGGDVQPVAQVDSQPLGGTYPTRFWDLGERLADPHLLSVPLGVPSGEYELLVGMYLPSTGERLSLLNEDGENLGDSISLGQVRVVSP